MVYLGAEPNVHKEISLEKACQLTRMSENYLETPSTKKDVRRRSMLSHRLSTQASCLFSQCLFSVAGYTLVLSQCLNPPPTVCTIKEKPQTFYHIQYCWPARHRIRKHLPFLLFLPKTVKCAWGMHREEAGLGSLICPQCKEQAVTCFRRGEIVSSDSCIYSGCTGLYQSRAIFTTRVARWLCEVRCFTPKCRHKSI